MQVLFNVLMGLRRSKIIAVKYSDVDYVNRTLRVERQLGIVLNSEKGDFALKTYTKQELMPKTRSSIRELPIPDYVFEAILQGAKNMRRTGAEGVQPFNIRIISAALPTADREARIITGSITKNIAG